MLKNNNCSRLREIQARKNIFEKKDDVLCIGLDRESLLYLLELETNVSVITPEGITPKIRNKKIKVIKGNINAQKLKEELGSKVDVFLSSLHLSPFSLFRIIEKVIDSVSDTGKILIKIDASSQKTNDLKNIIEQLADSLSLYPDDYTEFDNEEIWVVLRRKK